MRRFRERGVDRRLVAVAPVVADVVGDLVVHGRADRVGRAQVDHRWQLLVLDLDELGRVLGLEQRLGDDERDLVADVPHLALRQHRVRRLLHRRAVLAVDQPAARQATDLGLGEIGAGDDVDDAGRLLRSVELDRLDARVRVRAAQEDAVGLPRQGDVVGVVAGAGDEAPVLAAAQALPDRALRQVDLVHVAHDVLPQTVVGVLPD